MARVFGFECVLEFDCKHTGRHLFGKFRVGTAIAGLELASQRQPSVVKPAIGVVPERSQVLAAEAREGFGLRRPQPPRRR